MKNNSMAVAALSAALVAAGDAQAVSAFVQTHAIEREVRTADPSEFQGEAVAVKLDFVKSGSEYSTRVWQLYGAAEQMRGADADDPYRFANLALSQERRHWSERTQRYAFFSYGLSVAQYQLPQIREADFLGVRVGAGAGYPLFRNRVILTTELDVQLLQQIGADADDNRQAELGTITGKLGLLWSFEHFGVNASYSYRYMNYYEGVDSDIVDVSQMLGIGIGFALD